MQSKIVPDPPSFTAIEKGGDFDRKKERLVNPPVVDALEGRSVMRFSLSREA